MNELESLLVVSGVLLFAIVFLMPPALYVLQSASVWSVPPFTWILRWWDYWARKGL